MAGKMHLFDIGVIVVKRQLKADRWASHAWLPYAVLPALPDTNPGAELGGDEQDTFFYAGPAQLVLQRSATAHYRDNIAAARPSLWIALRLFGDECEIASVTADPYEGEALTEGFGAVVEAVPMPDEIRAGICTFISVFHVERPFFKRQRDRHNPERRRAGGEQNP